MLASLARRDPLKEKLDSNVHVTDLQELQRMPTTTQRTHSPNCGAKLPEQPLSLCAYCAMPLELADMGVEQGKASESPNAPKLAKLLEQDALPEALEWTPPEGSSFQAGIRAKSRAVTLLPAGVVLLILGRLIHGGSDGGTSDSGGPGFASIFLTALGVLLTLGGITLWLRGSSACKRALSMPLLRRPAYIRDRRSETQVVGWGGRTTYYFELEFEGGQVAEFSHEGRGPSEDPYVNGMTGVAYTRGTELLHFRQVRI
jgi:hypothetical protein